MKNYKIIINKYIQILIIYNQIMIILRNFIMMKIKIFINVYKIIIIIIKMRSSLNCYDQQNKIILDILNYKINYLTIKKYKFQILKVYHNYLIYILLK